MSEDDTLIWRMHHVEVKCGQLDTDYEKISTKITDIEKYDIRQEGSQKELTTAVGALATNLTAVTVIVNEIKDRPLQTHRALIKALWAVAVVVVAFGIENAIMFYVSALSKGLIK